MSFKEKIGVAFLGVGRMGESHLRCLGAIPNARVVAVADPRPDAAEKGKRLSGADRAFTNVEEAISHPGVDAVVIVTPTNTHAHLIELAAMAGKAIFCEKPIALDLKETTRIVKVVEGCRVPVQLGFMRRFDPGYPEAKQKVEAGELGKIEIFRASSRDTFPPPLEFLLSCGGIFLDMAIHDFDLARFLVGEVQEVEAWADVLFEERFKRANDADTAITFLRFANGAFGVIETARHSNWGFDTRTELSGSLAKVVLEAPERHALAFVKNFSSSRDQVIDFPDRYERAYRAEFQAFFQSLAEGTAPSPGPKDALETLRLALAATRSWREHRTVRVNEVQP